ncbi:septal ring lytic transglycosylase RlpA family protein [Allopusillimonas soli]|nr:septal ring lytic transglycosylase RlpA family protein [Allopusillimonas soli]
MIHTRRLLLPFSLALAVLAGCAGPGGSGGGYYKDDGPGTNIPANIQSIPNAVPRIETHARANFRPYTVFGKRYVPISAEQPFRETGTASWYGRKFQGNKTANGEIYDMYAMTAAHPTLPLPSYARVTRVATGKSVIVRINDRGPFHSSRIIDLSYAAAAKLGLIKRGSGKVIVEAITNDDIRNGLPELRPAPDLPRPEPRILVKTVPPDGKNGTVRVVKADGTTEPAQPAGRRAVASQSISPDSSDDAISALLASRMGVRVQDDGPGALPPARSTLGPTPAPDAATLPEADSQLALDGASDAAGRIYLQFGAFSAADTASKLAHRLNDGIGAVETRSARVERSGALYRVRIGPYLSRTDAVNAALRIEQETGMGSTVALR